jgi:twitching motility protein PilT
MARVDQLFRYLKDQGGSDLHLAAGLRPHIRKHGHLEEVPNWQALTDPLLRELLREVASEGQWLHYQRTWDLDLAYALEGVGRFRVNFFNQENGAAAVFRLIPEKINTFEELGLPQAVGGLAELEQGLVLVTGPTGSGKSTTLAAIINRINETSAKHIVTIEDPIEFVHQNKKSTISQREIGANAKSFGTALRAAIRQDAEVILVGELRDFETISLALTAAEMGILVFGTLHTNSAAKTIDRLIDAFPTDQQAQARTMLSESLAGVVSQLLLRTADGNGRVAVFEILLKNAALPNIIREANSQMLASIIQSGKQQGMQSMDDALLALVKSGRIKLEEALAKATHKLRFEELQSTAAQA